MKERLKIYVLGNPLLKKDNYALKLSKKLSKVFPDVEFKEFDPLEHLEGDAIFLDVSPDVDEVIVLGNKDLDKIAKPKLVSLHDYDLSAMLSLYVSLGFINNFRIIVVPIRHDNEKQIIEKLKHIIENIMYDL